MKLCKCGYPLVGLMAVYGKEYACFKCGDTFNFFNDCKLVDKTPELELSYKDAETMKNFFYKKYQFESEGNYTKSLTHVEFKEWVVSNVQKESKC